MNNMWTRNRLLKSLLALGLLPLGSFAQSKVEAQKEDLLPDKVDVYFSQRQRSQNRHP